MKHTLVRLVGVVWCVVATAVPTKLVAGSTSRETVPPSAVRTWAEIVSGNARTLMSIESQPLTVVRPPIPGPQPVNTSGADQAGPVSPLSDAGSSRQTLLPQGEPSLVLAPVLDFEAIPDNNKSIPPDTHGSVGPSHVMTTLNTEVRIQDKTGGVISTVTLNAFWASLGGRCYDPRVHYDAFHSRWITTCAVNPESLNAKIYMAISSTTDPTGAWTFYSFNANAGGTDSTWGDYPVVGFNKNWIAITANMFRVRTNAYSGQKMWVIDKASALAGGSLGVTTFALGFDLVGGVRGSTMVPCVTYGSADTLYLVDNSTYFDGRDTTFLVRLSRITGTGPSPSWTVAPGSSYLGGGVSTGLFRVVNNFNLNVPDAIQKGSSILVDAGDPRAMNAVFRNGKIWWAHSGGLPGKIAPTPTRAAAFWYQIDPVAMPFPIVQSGVIDGGSGTFVIFPSIAANSSNDVCIGFSRSDASRYPEAAYSGRRSGDPIGTTKAVQLITAGASSYSKFLSGTKNRWGDYSNTSVDPTDDRTFWTIQEYAGTSVGSDSNSGRWGTRWAKIDPVLSFPTGVAGQGTVPQRTGLDQNYPNPFNPSTTLAYQLSAPGYVSLVIYDLLGRPVAELERGYHQAGSFTSTWDASRAASGIYFARFTVTDNLGQMRFSQSSGMVLMK
jgi:hypothetical protein